MERSLTCIECPTGCTVTVVVQNDKVVQLDGYGCRRGHDYAVAEVEHPERILTTTVPARGLSVRMLPVRTNRPIPRGSMAQAMDVIRMVTVTSPVNVGDVIVEDLLGLGVDVVATRSAA
jgi:CxxC motif-containing protein